MSTKSASHPWATDRPGEVVRALRARLAAAERAIARTAEPRFAPQSRMWAIDVARLALAAGDRATASLAASAMATAAGATHVPSVRGASLAVRGMLEHDPVLVADAIHLLGPGPRLVPHAQAHEALGAIHAERDVRRVSRALAGHGVRIRPTARRRETVGWAALSQTESTVATLIGEGLTNAQIAQRLLISRRTAESHVAHVLSKLDVPTRAAAARVVVERRSES